MTLLRIGRALALSIVFLLLLAREVSAQDSEAAYTLEVDSDAPAVSFGELAPRLSADLGQPVLPSTPGRAAKVSVTVRFRAATRELVVRADHGGGRVLERTVQPKEGEEATTAMLLAENLARDEARELLDGFAARQPPAAPPATAPPAAAPPPAAPPAAARPDPEVYVSAGLAYPIATNAGKPNAKTYFDLSLLYGRAGTVHGLQLSSFGAWASRELEGIQLTAFGGYARRVEGAQIAGAANVAREVDGAQIAGAFDYAHDLRGAQIAGGLAYADAATGLQLASVNVAREIGGLQLGVVNVARKVKGLQLGVVNVAEEVEGTSLGLVSISKNSVHPVAYVGNLAFWNFGVKFQVGYVYTLFAFTHGTLETKYRNFATTGAIGGHVPLDALIPRLDLEPEVNLVHVIPEKANDNNLWLGGRLMVGYSFARHLRVFLGGGARFALIVNEGSKSVRPEAVGGVQF
ncbi:MAG: hypothetical protein KIT84_03740 [Labilithrix sp.]|nr:hypothetical protein [Labilithrix sp.]MCW5810096.1 hypothetical protein [Labilithrix sp.]